MPFQVSPGVNISEIDLTTSVPAVQTTTGAIGGLFSWGPVEKAVLVSDETDLINRFGKPSNTYYEAFFSASNFLAYGNALYVVRGVDGTANNAGAGENAAQATPILIKNDDSYDVDATGADSNTYFFAKYPGALGNSLKISVCGSANAYNRQFTATNYEGWMSGNTEQADAYENAIDSIEYSIAAGATSMTITVTANNDDSASNTYVGEVADDLQAKLAGSVGDYLKVGNTSAGQQYLRISSVGSVTDTYDDGDANTTAVSTFTVTFNKKNTTGSTLTGSTIDRYWEYYNVIDRAPQRTQFFADRNSNTSLNDAMHVIVEDEDGAITGTAGTLLEVFENVSRAEDAKNETGGDNFYKTVLRDRSNWVYWGSDPVATGSNTAVNIASNISDSGEPLTYSFFDGDDGSSEATATGILEVYDIFKNKENIDIGLVIGGKANGTAANYMIDNIAEFRKDCMVCVSPERADVVDSSGNEVDNIIDFRNSLTSSSFAVLDSGYKYQYDKYNDVYRYVPLNGDTAGTMARTDLDRDPWFSPGGFQRGTIKNVVKLAFSPNKAERDELYKRDINPISLFPGQGVVLFGDKTLLGRPSAFDRINVRRLFIVLEKAIGRAAESLLFEFNDEFTRAQFRNLVEPFLRDVQGRRGITDFKVVCDETNNTAGVIDRNEFVGDIYIKPNRSINFIQLNFVAVRSGVEFNEIIGSV
jgi:hypothetical protein